MKDINEITRLNEQELERIAADNSIHIPEQLDSKLRDNIVAAQLASKKPARHVRSFSFAIAGAALALILALALPWQTTEPAPKDTFSSPEEAYAYLEKTFSYMGDRSENALKTVFNNDKIK